jgi:hydrogenase maturation protease
MSLIVGLGSPHGDDQLGWVAIDRIMPRLPAGNSALKVNGGLDLLECLDARESAVIIDSAAPAGQPGTLRTFDWPSPLLAECERLSTHGLGLVAALKLAEALDRLPRDVRIYTVEAHDTSPDAPLGTHVARQLDVLVAYVLTDLRSASGERKCSCNGMTDTCSRST